MITEQAAKILVESFVAAYHEAWAKAVVGGVEAVDLDAWAAAIDALEHRYFVPGARSGFAATIGDAPDLDPALEQLGAFGTDGGHGAVLASRAERDHGEEHHAWELALVAGHLRIKKVRAFLEPRGTPNVAPEEAEEILAAPVVDAPLRPLAGAAPPGDDLFVEGREVKVSGRSSGIVVRALGTLTTATGILTARDLGDDPADLAAFARRIAPGSYPAEAAIAGGTVLALRLRIGEGRVHAWHPADRVGGGHVVPVDTANVAILDVAPFTKIDTWDRERLFDTHVVDVPAPDAHVFALASDGEPDAVVATSGYGDGAYPAFWGVDAEGAIVRLLVDFLV